ncbi:MAG: Gfo/Idh/MocA family oxidoreductase [Pirellulales bacterium]|jgi:predicted dehydrogenase|nr:Gfo/Idh/MocA family oxidoreductase [Thermoguttaceae bacterium]MDD4788229.1 Gfo/Idh/MocA family oxidoreductase [Pirellulales bacterium]NLZ01763.1 Gfo/Idh/MocA family oxidoreductase [Pirellulaceae bacterium]
MTQSIETRNSRRSFLKTSSAAALAGALASPLGFPSVLRGAAAGELKLGLISAATYGYMGAARTPGSFHGTAFATVCNGYDEAKRKQFEGTFVAARKRIDGAQVVRVWDPVKPAAERLAAACGIARVCDAPEECAEGVDAVLIVDDGSGEQWKYALAPLRKGVPTFCDKPLAMTAKQAKEVADLARKTGTPLMSASSLRFVPDILALAKEAPSLGEIHLATTVCGNELVYYGIHALEMAYAVLGGGAVSCLNVGQPGRNIVRVRFQNGRDLVLMVGEREWMRAGYQINLYGSKGWRSLTPNLDDLYWYLIDKFFELVRSGKESVPIEEEVEVIAVLEAGKRSLAEQREVPLAEVLQ